MGYVHKIAEHYFLNIYCSVSYYWSKYSSSLFIHLTVLKIVLENSFRNVLQSPWRICFYIINSVKNAVISPLISNLGVRKNHRHSGLGSRMAARKHSSDFYFKTGELTRLSEQTHCYHELALSCFPVLAFSWGFISKTFYLVYFNLSFFMYN